LNAIKVRAEKAVLASDTMMAAIRKRADIGRAMLYVSARVSLQEV
jgi:hypothetical protein